RHDRRRRYRSGQDRVLRGDCAVRGLGNRRGCTRRAADASVGRLHLVSVKAPCEGRSHGAFISHFTWHSTNRTAWRTRGPYSPPLASTARVVSSGPKSSALLTCSNSASRVRARLTRDLMVPTAHPQIPAASSYEKPEAPTRISASRWSAGSCASASRNSLNSTWPYCSGCDLAESAW